MQIEQEGMSLLVGDQKHPLLGFGRLHFVVLDNEFLLQDLDRIQLLGALRLGKHDFTKVALSEHS